MNVLVTGATGYIGGRLIPKLLERGHRVRVLVRRREAVVDRPWAASVEVVTGDLLKPETLTPALAGMDAAYYLIHSMYGGGDFARVDRTAAHNFVAAAKALKLVIYLGGLLPENGDQSASSHLASRAEVGRILREGLPTTELRAGPIIGSGSASFEMLRYLTERLPAMVAPKWILNPVQPIAVRDTIAYLLLALDRPPLGVVEIGTEALSFKQMMLIYAQVRGLRRWIVPVPVLAPTLAARWVGLVTPIPNMLAVPLIEGVKRPLLLHDNRARELFPEVTPLPYRRAVELALEKHIANAVETRWSGAMGPAKTFELSDWEGMFKEVHSIVVAAPTEAVFRTFTGLGGERGWLRWDWTWWVRGLLDRVVGGPGLRRGRRDPHKLLPGEAVDFWRVEAIETNRLLRLRAEMKVPGRAWLQFEAIPEGEGSRLVQTAMFVPKGLSGAAYWYLLYPIHRVIFAAMVRAVAREAEALIL